jgi:methylenetetrahydrofolate dehydrogenase (NADP+) / methenyltetrahydrofolate cyclohydrolase
MSALKLDGRRAADQMLKQLKKKVVRARRPITLATILVGSRYDSALYVKLKRRAAARVGIHTEAHHLSSATNQLALQKLIRLLNKLNIINGILLQLPLPKQLNADDAVATINPAKDVDGFQPNNTLVIPPPVGAVLKLIALGKPKPKSFAVIVAQQSVFTERLAQALDKAGHYAAVVEPHRHMKDIITKADIVIAALGAGPRIIARDVKRGAICIDVGIRQQGKNTIGDFHPSVWAKTKAISPVPGGVGPLTVACVLENTCLLATRR